MYRCGQALTAQMIGAAVPAPTTAPVSDTFVKDIEELAELLISEASRETYVPVDLRHKRHKLELIRSLKSRGFFLVREGGERIASALQVTHLMIYNYLNETSDEAGDAGS